jgi:YbbR domain-containing protein
VEIGPVISSRQFNNLRFSFVDSIGGRSIRSDVRSVSATLTGPVNLLNALKSSALYAYVDVGSLEEGEHELPVSLDILDENQQRFTYDITPQLVRFRINPD